MSGFATDYIDVATRVAEFRAKHPEGSLQPLHLDRPYWTETLGDKLFIVYAAAAYRTPDDPRPGVGLAYEPFPGKTNFTRDSELQNAETAAWGRAIMAAMAADSRKGIASAEEVRNRRAEQERPRERHPEPPPADEDPALAASRALFAQMREEIDAASTASDLATAAAAIRDAAKAGELDPGQMETLRRLYATRADQFQGRGAA